MSHQLTTFTREILSAVQLLSLLCLLSFTVNADTSSATDGSTPLGLQPGAPAGAYALSDFDNINLFNGNLSFQLSLLGISGRGTAQIPVLLPIEGKWRVIDIAIPQINGSYKHQYMPVQAWWENNDRKYRPGSLVGRQGSFDEFTCPDDTTVYSATLRRLTFTAPDGTEYELRDQLTGGQVMGGAGCNYANPPSRGRVFVTADGSAATFVSDATIYDNVIASNPAEFFPSGYLMLRDGTRFRIESGRVVWMRDRNGNKLTFGYDSNNRVQTITDTLNRVVTISRNTGPGTFDQVTYKGFGGATRIVRVNYSSLASALRSDYPSTLTYKSLFPALNGSSTSYHNPSVISAITLPNNQQYIVEYNPYGEIARVVLPTGGAIEYDYAAGAGGDESGAFGGGYEGSWVVYRRVVERRVYPDGGIGAAYSVRMAYSRNESECAGCVKVDQLNSSGILLSRSKHYFYGNAAMSFATGPTDYPGWQEGREYQTEEFAGDGASILRKTVNTWQQPTGGASWPLGQSETSAGVKTNNPQITQIVTTLEPAQANKVSKQTFTYDKYTNRTDVYEYDFDNGATGLLRHTHTDFLTSSYDTLNPSSSNPDLSLTSHIRNLATQVSIFDAGGVERARSTTEYDNYALDGADCLHSFHCPLLPRSNVSGFDSSFTTSYTKRGNPTAVTRYLLSNGSVTGSISSYSQFDIAGNIIRVLDPRSTLSNNIVTTIEYDDRFGTPDSEARSNSTPADLAGYNSFAFATRVINPLGHTTYAQFDYYLGRPINGEDANGVVASGAFSDPLDRPTLVRRAIGTSTESQTLFSYNDLTRTITTFNDRDANGDGLLVNAALYDQMGRAVETRQYESGGNFIATQTQYDALGRPYKTSNPFRPWQGETPVWTTTAFDALGRVLTVTTPDNAVVGTSYSGNSVTVTDQAGKARKSVTDGLGRLIEVYEDPNGVNYQTSYVYDSLDNLVTVTQGSQQRFFMYDSLKRLIRADNPEQETLSTLSINDPVTNHPNWSAKYEYDNNGNLTFKTDARGVVIENRYDVLNRLTTVLYRISGQPDPNTGDIEYLYDNATNGKGRLWLTYRWGAKPSHTAVSEYDAMGRVKQLWNLFGDGQGGWSTGYGVSRNYNLAGAVIAQTYPSGRTVNYAYDAAERTTGFTGNLGDGVTRSYASSFLYNARSQVTQELFGTQTPLYHKLQYNVRGQLWDVRVSTNPDVNGSMNRGGLRFFYDSSQGDGSSGPDNNGNVLSANIYSPEDEQLAHWATTRQGYSYDSLNRLKSVTEYFANYSHPDSQPQFVQTYDYDRWGNRTINAAQTSGAGINNTAFEVQPSSNRLYSPGDLAPQLPENDKRIRYDKAGNQIKDTYTGYGAATFDGDNHIVAIQDKFGGSSTYTYNANAQRVRRRIDNQETWQIYGIDGELVAEYAANSPVSSAQKEYGYRDGQLLITAEAAVTQNVSWTNTVGVSVNGNNLTKTAATGWGNAGATSAQSITAGDGYMELSVPDTTTHRFVGLSNGNSNCDYTDVDFAIHPVIGGTIYIYEGGVSRGTFGSYTPGDVLRVGVEGGVVKYRKNGALLYTSTIAPIYPLLVDSALHGTGDTLSNVIISGASLTNAQSVSWENVVGASHSGNTLTKTAATGWGNAGATSTQSITAGDGYVELTVPDMTTHRFVGLSNGNSNCDYTDVDFAIHPVIGGTIYIYEGGVSRGTFGSYVAGDVLRVGVEGGVVKYRKNGALLYTSTITPTYPLLVDSALHGTGDTLTNVVINSGGSGAVKVQWLVPDHLGTPRIILDQTGAFANVKRHDYLPFGQELSVGTGGRTTAMGYVAGDGIRQQFTSKERDIETGLDYFGARYYSSVQGRFTSIDPMGAAFSRQIDPQQLNRYSTVRNNPLRYTDPDGRDLKLAPGLKKADQDRIIKRAVNLYRKATGRAAIESMASSDIKFEVDTGNLPSKINLMDRTVKETYGETKGYGFKGTKDPNDPSKFATMDRTSGTVKITFDFSKRKDAEVSYNAGLSSAAPPSEQHLLDHEFGHANDMNKDMVKEANQGEQQAEKNAETFADAVEKEKDTVSKEDAEKRVREILGIPAQPPKKKGNNGNE